MNDLDYIEELCHELHSLTGRNYDGSVKLWLLGAPAERGSILARLELERRRLAGTERGTWLEPIPEDRAQGDIELGQVVSHERELHPYRMPLSTLLRHVTIFGQSGSGKTNLGYLLLRNLLSKNVPFLVLDWKRNYRDLLAFPEAKGKVEVFTVGRDIRPFHLNPLIPPPGTSPETWLKKITEVVAKAFYVGEGVMSILHSGIDAVYQQFGVYAGTVTKYPTFREVRAWVDEYVKRASMKDLKPQWIASTKRTLQALCYGETDRVVNVANPTPVHELLCKPVVLELDALSEAEKTLIIQTLLLWVHHYRLQDSRREELKHVIVIEEAHHVLRREDPTAAESIFDVVIREIRELGEGLVMIDQSPHAFSETAIGNSGTSFVFALKDRADVATAANFLVLDIDQRELIHQLPIGTCVVKAQDGYRKPFLVKLPHVRVPKGATTDATLRTLEYDGLPSALRQPTADLLTAVQALTRTVQETRSLRSDSGFSTQDQPLQGERGARPGDASADKRVVSTLTEEQVLLLKDILDHPDVGVSNRYERLKWSARNGNRVKDSLEQLGVLAVALVNKGDSQVKLLTLTPAGKQLVRQVLPDRHVSRALESAQHRYWKNKIASALSDAGLHVEVEKPLNGDRVDVHAENGGTTAIEVETGKSNIKHNIEKDLKAGYDRVIIIPTDKKARRKVEKALGR